MIENTETTVDLVEGQIDLFTNEVVTIEEKEITEEDVTKELIEAAFEGVTTITSYKLASIINGIFKVVGFDKQIPPQMMYNYSKNGMINGTKDMKQKYNKDEVTKFVTKYIKKQLNK